MNKWVNFLIKLIKISQKKEWLQWSLKKYNKFVKSKYKTTSLLLIEWKINIRN